MKTFDLYQISSKQLDKLPISVLECISFSSEFKNYESKLYFKHSNFTFLGFEILERKIFHNNEINYLKFLNLSTGKFFVIPEVKLVNFEKIEI